jgi:PAS domain S-box-containing protein
MRRPHARPFGARIALGLLLTLSYFVTARLGLLLAIPPGYATAIWPASGIALAGLLLLGWRYWPAVLMGSMLVNINIALDNSSLTLQSILVTVAVGTGATLQAIVASQLIWRHTRGSLVLARERDIFGFYVLGGPVAHMIAPSVGVATLYFNGFIPSPAVVDNWWTWWAGDTIGALIFAPLVIMWLGRTADWASRRVIVSVPLLTMFIAAVATFIYANRAEWRDLRQHLTDDAGDVAQTIAKRVDVDVELLRAFGAYLQADTDTDREAFTRFASNVLTPREEIISLQWAPVVDQPNRQAFESAMRSKGLKDFSIWDTTPNLPASERASYLPVELAAPSGRETSIGLDLRAANVAHPELQDTIETAITDKDIRAIPIALPELNDTANKRSGLLVALPVFDAHHYTKVDPSSGARNTTLTSHLRGVVVATFNTSKLVYAATHDSALLAASSLIITDRNSNTGIGFVTFQSAPTQSTSPYQRIDGEGIIFSEIHTANRLWTLQFAPTLQYLTEHKPTASWLVLAGGLMFTALIGAGALLITGRGLSVELLVSQRTKELAHINETLADEICDHLNTEHALDKERESLKAVLNNLHEGILVYDSVGLLRIANGAALRMHREITGLELDLIRGPSPFAVFSADGKTPIAANDMPQAFALRGETVRDFEVVAQTSGREALCLSMNAQPLFTSDGKQHGAIVVVRDITDTHKIERMKTEFVATVSHELRTPITSIRGSLGLLAAGTAGQLTDKMQHLIEIALRNSDRLALLINDLLDIEKIDSGNMRFDLQPHVLRDLIEQSIEANGGYAQSFNVKLTVSDAIPLVYVSVDADRLLQVLANLLSNAAKFSPTGANVDISAHTLVQHNTNMVRVCVRDHGPGIAEEFRSRLFQKFSQADASDARTKNGTGLGLAISKSIIERLGGSIGYTTQVGAGTTFYFDLPISSELVKLQEALSASDYASD